MICACNSSGLFVWFLKKLKMTELASYSSPPMMLHTSEIPNVLMIQYLLLTEFEVHTLSYGPSFFPFNLWPKRKVRGP